MLVDDSRADNYYHRVVINDTGLAEDVIDFTSPVEALEYLRTTANHPVDLILLDLNMPGMTGYEFLDEYKQIDKGQQAKVIVVLLTNSLRASDKMQASEDDAVAAFVNKPLTEDHFVQLVDMYFPAK